MGYKDNNVDMDGILALELPTRLVWENLPAETKKHLQVASGQKGVIASFQTFPNARHRLPNEAMEVYAAAVCRLVKEAFLDFEQNATEYMKMSRFFAGLNQELQVKCHERGVKTFKEAFEVARQAARLVMPVSPPTASSDVSTSVNYVADSDTSLRNAVRDLTATVKDLNRDLGALKLEQSRMHHREMHMPRRSHRSPSQYESSPGRYPDNWDSCPPPQHFRHSSPEPSHSLLKPYRSLWSSAWPSPPASGSAPAPHLSQRPGPPPLTALSGSRPYVHQNTPLVVVAATEDPPLLEPSTVPVQQRNTSTTVSAERPTVVVQHSVDLWTRSGRLVRPPDCYRPAP